MGGVDVPPHLGGIAQKGQVVLPLPLHLPGRPRPFRLHPHHQAREERLSLLLVPGVPDPPQGVPGLLEALGRELGPEVALQVQEAELALRVGEEPGHHLPKPTEVIRHEAASPVGEHLEQDPVHPSGHQVLQNLDPKSFALSSFQGPQPQGFLTPLQVNPHRHKEGKVHPLALLGPELGPVGAYKNGKPVCLERLGLVEVQRVLDEGLGLPQGPLREGELQRLQGP